MAELVALVELGSNATRCLLACVTPGVGFHVIVCEHGVRDGLLLRETFDGEA